MLVRQLIKRLGHGVIKLSDLGTSTSRNLSGDRHIEWSWVAAHLPDKPGVVLDFGCGDAFLSLIAAMRGGQVVGLDRQPVRLTYQTPCLKIQVGDILNFDFGRANFDVIINCSSIEHVGLAGRYGSASAPDGDLMAMERLKRLLKPAGIMILTVPVGQDAVFAPYHRVYGPNRLALLLNGFQIVKKEFWSKQANLGMWTQVVEDEALSVQPSASFYALGLFILKSALDAGSRGS